MDIKRRAWKFERWKAFSWDFHCEALSKFVEIPKNHCFLGNVLKCKSLYKANLSASIKFKSKMAFVMLIWNANPLSIRMHIKYHSQLPHHCKICTHTLRLSMQSRKIALDIACIRCKVFWKTMKSYLQNKFAHAQSVCIINYFAMCGCSTIYMEQHYTVNVVPITNTIRLSSYILLPARILYHFGDVIPEFGYIDIHAILRVLIYNLSLCDPFHTNTFCLLLFSLRHQ